jgi:2,4-dienoyl-CoA reductase-like NADH-dependent reductase (Old Yellow Enzyme family)
MVADAEHRREGGREHRDADRGAIDPFAPTTLGRVRLRNRFLKAATFEGMARKGLVTDRLVDFHRVMAAGGVGMTTVAYLAVSPDGRGAPSEIVVRPEAADGLARLAEVVHGEGAAVSAQLGHAGPVAAGTGHTGLAPSRVFSPMAMKFTKAVTDDDIDRVVGDFARAAVILRDAGFDAVELHFGHSYLISAFLSPALNKRKDRWGGSVEARAALARRVAEEVRRAVGPELTVLAKLNMVDGFRGGLWIDDSVAVARMLEADGHLDALELTGGSSFRNPMFLFRGDAPIAEMAQAFPQPVRTAFRVAGKRFLIEYPFQEAYFLPLARQIRDAVSMPLVLLGGINRIETVRTALDDGFELVALGRALLREPNLLRRWQGGDSSESLCIHCNKCMPTIYRGTHCVLVPPDERPGHSSPPAG